MAYRLVWCGMAFNISTANIFIVTRCGSHLGTKYMSISWISHHLLDSVPSRVIESPPGYATDIAPLTLSPGDEIIESLGMRKKAGDSHGSGDVRVNNDLSWRQPCKLLDVRWDDWKGLLKLVPDFRVRHPSAKIGGKIRKTLFHRHECLQSSVPKLRFR